MAEQPSDIKLDLARAERTGLAEAVFCEAKSDGQLAAITRAALEAERPMLYTRLAAAQFARLEAAFPKGLDYDPISRTAFVGGVQQGGKAAQSATASARQAVQSAQPSPGKPAAGGAGGIGIAVVSGGSSDLPVAREAVRTLHFYGHPALEVHDVGVAGLWRLTERLDELRACRIIICAAGMEAALPTVLGGLVPAALIAVPTSIGYGMAKGGEAALRALLSSCAPGIAVTNIDNGYGAACVALRILNNFPARK